MYRDYAQATNNQYVASTSSHICPFGTPAHPHVDYSIPRPPTNHNHVYLHSRGALNPFVTKSHSVPFRSVPEMSVVEMGSMFDRAVLVLGTRSVTLKVALSDG